MATMVSRWPERFAAVAIAGAVAVFGGQGVRALLTPGPAREPVAACQEDDPCWDCRTMGNLVCGPLGPSAERPECDRWCQTDTASAVAAVASAASGEACWAQGSTGPEGFAVICRER